MYVKLCGNTYNPANLIKDIYSPQSLSHRGGTNFMKECRQYAEEIIIYIGHPCWALPSPSCIVAALTWENLIREAQQGWPDPDNSPANCSYVPSIICLQVLQWAYYFRWACHLAVQHTVVLFKHFWWPAMEEDTCGLSQPTQSVPAVRWGASPLRVNYCLSQFPVTHDPILLWTLSMDFLLPKGKNTM